MTQATPYFSPPDARLVRVFARPKTIALVCLLVLTGAGWLSLGLMAAAMARAGHGAALGPGLVLVGLSMPLDELGRTLIDAFCRPHIGHGGATGIAPALLSLSMWCAMTLAMMLPTAAPMIVTYAEIAETAQAKGERVVAPLVLVAGYTAVWLGFAVVATALQVVLERAAWLDATLATHGPISSALLIAAGLYQFSRLKHACLIKCQRPFPFFLTHWTTRTRGVLRLGLRQGLYCLGCCGALMLVMFAVGLMNVVWMATLGAVMAIEKMTTTAAFARAIGFALIAAGGVVALASLTA